MKKSTIIVIQALIFTALIIGFIVIRKSNPESGDLGIKLEDFKSDYASFSNGEWQIDENTSDISDEADMLYGPFLHVSKGDYTMVAAYDCEHNQSIIPYAANGNDIYREANTIPLNPKRNFISYDFRITEDIDNFEIRVKYDGRGSVNISEISIYRNNNS